MVWLWLFFLVFFPTSVNTLFTLVHSEGDVEILSEKFEIMSLCIHHTLGDYVMEKSVILRKFFHPFVPCSS